MADPTEVIVVLSTNTTKLALAASPYTAAIDRENQQIVWNIGVPGFYWPDTDGVRPLRDGLPPGYSPWPGDTPTLNDKHQYVANANKVLPQGSPREKYKYDIFLVDSGGETHVLSSHESFAELSLQYGADRVVEVDPDIQNDPLP